MSAICGFYTPHITYASNDTQREKILYAMLDALHRRGPDSKGTYVTAHGGIGYGELNAAQLHPSLPYGGMPYSTTLDGKQYTLVYDGFISNLMELAHETKAANTQEEILLEGFHRTGPMFVQRLRGAFALVLVDHQQEKIYLFRDQLGLRPLYYLRKNHAFVFASEPKGILCYPGTTATIGINQLQELFAMGPARSLGAALYKDMYQVKAGHYIEYSAHQLQEVCYHQFSMESTSDSYEDIVFHVKELLQKSIDTLSCVCAPTASLLSGGLDSSVITSALCKNFDKNLMQVRPATFSFDFLGSRKHFVPNSFQPSLDAPFVKEMTDYLGTDHTTLICSNKEQFEYLEKSVIAHDGPAMADVDSSMLYFCERIAPSYPIVFSGECADELFCGYPWYHNTAMIHANRFPWSKDLCPRTSLLNDDYISLLHMEDYVSAEYLSGVSDLDAALFKDAIMPEDYELIHKRTMYLTIRYFMQTLVDRADGIASYCSMDLRVPFADLDLAEYLFSVPYSIKTAHGEVKHLLRCYGKDLLPETVCNRRKSPYPKTYDPGYENLLRHRYRELLADGDAPILSFLDKEKLENFLEQPSDYGTPWYGQLMAGPQLLAYYLQINYWLSEYNINIET